MDREAAPDEQEKRHWWRELPVKGGYDNPEWHWLQWLGIALGWALDWLLVLSINLMTVVLILPMSLRPSLLRRDRDQRDFYCQLAEDGDAGAFYRPPEGVPDVRLVPGTPWRGPRLPVGQCYQLSFASDFEAANPVLRKAYRRHSKNHVAQAQYWCHGDRPRPTLCVIHGFVLDAYSVNSRFFALRWFYRQGYDIVLYTLPFHGYRQGLLSPFSGHGYFAHGPLHVNESFAQAVYDFRHLMNWLESRGVERFGVMGISLGGYTTALLASVETRLNFAVPVVPPANLVDVAFRWFPLGLLLRTLLKAVGIDRTQARQTLAVTSALSWQPVIPREHLLIVGAPGDAITYPQQHQALFNHWKGAQMIWVPGGHVLHFEKRRYLKAIRGLMMDSGFAEGGGDA
ncbi:MAG: alpha/beta hydrolase [Pseudomonadota bacterium]